MATKLPRKTLPRSPGVKKFHLPSLRRYSCHKSQPLGPFIANSISGQSFAEERMQAFGTLRGRFGWLPWDPVLVYATGGIAFAKMTSTATLTQTWNAAPLTAGTCCLAFNPSYQSTTEWRAGPTVGGGAEIALGARWSLKGEYLVYYLSDWSHDMSPIQGLVTPPAGTAGAIATVLGLSSSTRNFQGSYWRVGLNYNLGVVK